MFKNAQNGSFWRVFENLKLAGKQCYQTGQFQLSKNLVENRAVSQFLKCFSFGLDQALLSKKIAPMLEIIEIRQ